MIDVSGIKDYFEYIKEIYLKTFEKILDEDTKNRIINYKYDDIEYDMESEFDIKINGTIHYKLDIDSFINNNNLLNENLDDLNELERNQVKYILENKDNKDKIVKDSLLENLILQFLPKKDVLSYGMCTYLGNRISNNCHLNTMKKYYKEERIIIELIELLDEKTVLESILNGNIELLKFKYDTLSKDSFKNMYNDLQKEFSHYYKNINKVYYIDSLYNYSSLNYSNIINSINDLKIKKSEQELILQKRVNSILDCLNELERYVIILKEKEKNDLYYSTLNIKRILEKTNYLQYINEILTIENELKGIVDHIWNYYLNYEGQYDSTSNYYFLIQNYNQVTTEDFSVMHLITNDHTRVPINKNRYKYGFIYAIKEGAILYSSLDNIVYHETKENNNCYTINVDDKILEIDDMHDSKLITPRNLMFKTVEQNKEYNSVLVNQKKITKKAIYCICKSESDMDYMKAEELANKYELPLIPIHECDSKI